MVSFIPEAYFSDSDGDDELLKR